MAFGGQAGMNKKSEKFLSLKDILQVENDQRILDVRCTQTGIPLWTMIRVPFIRMIMSDMLYGTPLNGYGAIGSKFNAATSLSKALLHNIRFGKDSKKADILLMSHGLGNQLKDGLWFNRLGDHFALAHSNQTLLVEDFFKWQWPFPRHNQNILLHAPTQAFAAFAGKISSGRKHREQAHHLVSIIQDNARQLLGWELGAKRFDWLVTSLARKSAAIPWLYAHYQRLLTQVHPKILIKEEACYGPSSVLIRAARDLGIHTAEYQHGSVSAGHDAYNFADLICKDDEYRKTLPDYFLSYGRWWGGQINAPIKKVDIGNPHRTARLEEYCDYQQQERIDILILGDGIETDLYIRLAQQLADTVDERFQVVFRPHPIEKNAVLERFPEGRIDKIRIDLNSDIYQSFFSAHAVVSELSTGLFEAVGLVGNIFIWDTAKARFCYPQHPFSTFSDSNDLVSQLSGRAQKYIKAVQESDIWQPDWRKNYDGFLAGLGIHAN
ncbi:MAG: hypothetical protein Q7T66_03920 [Herminiimonas sp.]|nr:hypothetical protein [Herminiimonas sp.]